jgi:hypothetical protein
MNMPAVCCLLQGTLGSMIEWTAPSTANYFVIVRGYSPSERGAFILTVAQGSSQANDPCSADSTATGGDHRSGGNSGVISFTDSYDNGATCTWTISCDSPRDHVEVVFASLDVEQDYDFVKLYDSLSGGLRQLAQLTGSLDAVGTTTYDSTSNILVLQLESDESISGDGFELQYTCLGASPPPPASDITIQPDGQPVAASESGGGQWFVLHATVSSQHVTHPPTHLF